MSLYYNQHNAADSVIQNTHYKFGIFIIKIFAKAHSSQHFIWWVDKYITSYNKL